ncbi:MAG: adenylyltransferase/cytidyltransferase family protein [SAR324 cluster bacterium]|nr:adenylyltransferase/cytidyltransferase family protein [SAR324 cluster bacterium]
MTLQSKIITVSNLVEQRQSWKKNHQKVIFCYGHFNVIHPGHLRFLEYAKGLGQIVVVGVLGETHIADKYKAHYYSLTERLQGVNALHSVDYVVAIEQGSVEDIISGLCPEIVVLGKEFEEERRSEIQNQIDLVNQLGGQVIFHAGDVRYATADLLHGSLQELERERLQQFHYACVKQGINMKQLEKQLDVFSNCRMLVIGDTIVDQYVACDALGMSAEAPVLVVRELETREFVGGAAIVAAHVKALGAQCQYVSVVGQDLPATMVRQELERQGIQYHLFDDKSRPTTFKIRYMVEHQKLFRVSRLKEHSLPESIEDQIILKLRKLAPEVDGILVCDFVYGVITPRIEEVILDLAKKHHLRLFGDLQCSSQIGDVSKFKQFDLLCPTEKEARIALGNNEDGVEWIAHTLMEKTDSRNLVLKLGANGFIAYSKEQGNEFIRSQHFPAMTTNPVDVAGAGDSLISALAVSLCTGHSLPEASALGACVAALAVRNIGNIPVSHQQLREYLHYLQPILS